MLLSSTLPISCRGISGTGTVRWRSNCSSFALAVESPSSSASRIICYILPLASDICFIPACVWNHAVITLLQACAATLAVRAMFLRDAVNRMSENTC